MSLTLSVDISNKRSLAFRNFGICSIWSNREACVTTNDVVIRKLTSAAFILAPLHLWFISTLARYLFTVWTADIYHKHAGSIEGIDFRSPAVTSTRIIAETCSKQLAQRYKYSQCIFTIRLTISENGFVIRWKAPLSDPSTHMLLRVPSFSMFYLEVSQILKI